MPFLFLTTVFYWASYILATAATPAGNIYKVGQRCSLSPAGIPGVCTNVVKCGYAVSNYKAGVQPTLCAPVKNGVAIVCCPTQERISAKKCSEYSKMIEAGKKITLHPLLASSSRQQVKPKQDGATKCDMSATAYITGGQNAKANEFPHMAALGYGEIREKKWKCGGTIISDEFVLTAAHCIDTRFGKPRRILVGSLYLQEPGSSGRKTLVAVKETIVHPNYRRPLKYNDIALLRLAKKLPLSKSIFPACLPQPNTRPENVKMGKITGWGNIEANDYRNSNILQAASLERYNQSTCNELFLQKPDRTVAYPQGIIRSQFCAGDKVKDTCGGDSGGPFTINHDNSCLHYVTGITSFGSVFCGYGEPGVYTNVQSYLDWIESIVWPN